MRWVFGLLNDQPSRRTANRWQFFGCFMARWHETEVDIQALAGRFGGADSAL
jgi:hypothetical protein